MICRLSFKSYKTYFNISYKYTFHLGISCHIQWGEISIRTLEIFILMYINTYNEVNIGYIMYRDTYNSNIIENLIDSQCNGK